jgi:hypothetical protein
LTLLPSPFEKLKVKKGVVVCGRIELSFGPIAGEVIDKIREIGKKVDTSVEQAILEAVRTLPFNRQQEILAHATRLRDEATPKFPFPSIQGIPAS